MDLLLEKGPAVGPKTKYGNGFLLIAAMDKRGDIVQRLEEKGAVYEGSLAEVKRHMCSASFSGNIIMVSLLLKYGANPNFHNKGGGLSPLMFTTHSSQKEAAALLLKHGADINDRSLRDGMTAVFYSLHADLEFIRLLLENGADPGIPDNSGKTLLLQCIDHKYDEKVRLLLEHGADPNIKDAVLGTPLLKAAAWCYDCVEVLLGHGADPNSENSSGETALRITARTNSVEVMSLLIKNGARTDGA